MLHGKGKRKQGREHFPEPPPLRARTGAPPVDNLSAKHTRLEAAKERNQGKILSKLSRLVSDISEMKRLITEPPDIKTHMQEIIEQRVLLQSTPPRTNVDNLTFERLEMEVLKQSQILSTLTDTVSDIFKMKRLYTEPPEIKILPLHIQEEIMKRLPVKSLVRFRSVSRSWKSLIDSFEFIADYIRTNHQPKHVLVDYRVREEGDAEYVSFADNHSLPYLRYFPGFPPSISESRMVGSSYGLFCLYCYYSERKRCGKAVIWNPCIGKSIAIHVPKEFYDGSVNNQVIGFGVCPVTLDPKIVQITHLCAPQASRKNPEIYKQFGNFWKVNVYKLSSKKFTNLSNLPSVSIRIGRCSTQVVIDRLIYWCAQEDGTTRSNLIMSFDITDEKFQKVELPEYLADLDPSLLSVSKLRESLVMLQYNKKRTCYHVWKMEHGSFTNILTINAPSGSIMIRGLGFRNTGEPIMSVEGSSTSRYYNQLVYQPNSKKRYNLLLSSYADTYSVESYMETLLLFGRSDCISTTV